ncbi:MAG: CpaD family pilus assembly lipoprotein [Emcibacteraceae bacterium]
MKKNINNKFSDNHIGTITKSVILGMSCIFLTTGCASQMANFSGVEQQTRNEVEMVRIPYNIQFNNDVVELSDTEIGKLNHFLQSANISYGDEFSMDFPLDRNGNISEIDKKRMAYVSGLLKKSGLYLSAEVTPFGMEPGNNSGRLLVSKYVVTPPECGDWSQKSYPNYENAPLNNLGCASQANLGLMIANPRDLVIGAKGGTPNTERTARAVERYQNGTTVVAPADIGSN